MITPTKKDRKCAVEQLPGGEDESPFMSLFERKRVKGWWPCYNIEGEDGKKKLAVRCNGIYIQIYYYAVQKMYF